MLLQFSCSVISYSLQPRGLLPARLLCPMGFPRPEYWNGLPLSSIGDLPDPGIEPKSPALEGGFFTDEPPEKPRKV